MVILLAICTTVSVISGICDIIFISDLWQTLEQYPFLVNGTIISNKTENFFGGDTIKIDYSLIKRVLEA